MFRGEAGKLVSPTPTENRMGESRFGLVTEKVPELVEEIMVNPIAKDLLGSQFGYLAQADYWRDQVCLTVPETRGATGIKSPVRFGRVLPLGYGEIEFGRFLGGTVLGKGCFRTGHYYRERHHADSTRDHPSGFFGSKDAKKEVEVANLLLSEGFRSSLPLVTVTYKEKETRDFLIRAWNYPLLRVDIDRCFEYLRIDKQQMAFLARLTGVTARLSWLMDTYVAAETVRTAQLLLGELERFPESFSSYLTNCDTNMVMARQVLGKLALRKKIDKNDFLSLVDIFVGIVANNAWALSRLQKSGKLEGYCDLGLSLGGSKDTCLAGFSLDYEDAGGTAQTEPVVSEYLDGVGHSFAGWLYMGVMRRFGEQGGTGWQGVDRERGLIVTSRIRNRLGMFTASPD